MNDIEQHLCDELTTMVREHGWEKTLTMLKVIAQGQAAALINTTRGYWNRRTYDFLAVDLHNASLHGRHIDERNRRLT